MALQGTESQVLVCIPSCICGLLVAELKQKRLSTSGANTARCKTLISSTHQGFKLEHHVLIHNVNESALCVLTCIFDARSRAASMPPPSLLDGTGISSAPKAAMAAFLSSLWSAGMISLILYPTPCCRVCQPDFAIHMLLQPCTDASTCLTALHAE